MTKDERWFSIRTAADTVNRIDKAAAKKGWSRTRLVVTAVTAWLKEQDLWSIPGPQRIRRDQ
jgi:uncharacterized protein (DUF1778 family)